jgi:hypothetical protein
LLRVHSFSKHLIFPVALLFRGSIPQELPPAFLAKTLVETEISDPKNVLVHISLQFWSFSSQPPKISLGIRSWSRILTVNISDFKTALVDVSV